MKKIIVGIFLVFAQVIFGQKFENLALTPPMGWNSWNNFGCNVSEQMIREMADAMVETGMRDAGYIYINIDDCWQGERDSLGFIQADPQRFPSGMKALAEYIHSLGLKLGIYSDAGWMTCAGRAGSRGYEFQDALQYAKWGIDYLKYDWCYTEGLNAKGAYLTMRDALHRAGRPIVFSMCEWGGSSPWKWAKDVAHLWRTTGDITNCFTCSTTSGFGVLNILDKQKEFREYAGPGHWNDPDMMEVGNGMTTSEDRAHFSMWCILAAPLIAGNDLRNMSEETLEILTNQEAIAVNQDSLGVQGFKYYEDDQMEIWFKPLSEDKWAVCFLNRSDHIKEVKHVWSQYYIWDNLAKRELNCAGREYSLFDIWKKKNVGTTSKPLVTKIPSHDVIMLTLSPKK